MMSETIGEIALALAKAQKTFQNPEKKGRGVVKGTTKSGRDYEFEYRYAFLSDGIVELREKLADQEISFTQLTEVVGDDLILRTFLIHSSGEWLASTYPVAGYSKMDHQKLGAALTYAKRQALFAITGLIGDDDTEMPVDDTQPIRSRRRDDPRDDPRHDPRDHRDEPAPPREREEKAPSGALTVEASEAEQSRMISELTEIAEKGSRAMLARWAHDNGAIKSRMMIDHATDVERAFAEALKAVKAREIAEDKAADEAGVEHRT